MLFNSSRFISTISLRPSFTSTPSYAEAPGNHFIIQLLAVSKTYIFPAESTWKSRLLTPNPAATISQSSTPDSFFFTYCPFAITYILFESSISISTADSPISVINEKDVGSLTSAHLWTFDT